MRRVSLESNWIPAEWLSAWNIARRAWEQSTEGSRGGTKAFLTFAAPFILGALIFAIQYQVAGSHLTDDGAMLVLRIGLAVTGFLFLLMTFTGYRAASDISLETQKHIRTKVRYLLAMQMASIAACTLLILVCIIRIGLVDASQPSSLRTVCDACTSGFAVTVASRFILLPLHLYELQDAGMTFSIRASEKKRRQFADGLLAPLPEPGRTGTSG